jgi:hypothetical protein
MGRDPAERRTPDPFPTATVQDAFAPPKLPAPNAPTETAPQRYVLPKNLRIAIKHLSDGELDLMFAATLEEMKRRGRTPQGVETESQARPDLMKSKSPPTEKRQRVDIAEVHLTRGQVSAVRAAFKAGITPSRISRQFGISQSNVRKALASDEPKSVNHMTIKADLAELERQHKAIEHEIAEALAHSSTDDLKIAELKRRKLKLKDEIERVRHDHAL